MRAVLAALVVGVLVLLVAPLVAYAGQTSAPAAATAEARDQHEVELAMAARRHTASARVAKVPRRRDRSTKADAPLEHEAALAVVLELARRLYAPDDGALLTDTGAAISLMLDVARRELRRLPEVADLRAPEPGALVAAIRPGELHTLDQIAKCIGDLATCAANLVERELPPESARPFREHVRVTYMRGFGINPASERHTRAALVGLVKVAAEDGRLPEGPTQEATESAQEEWLATRVVWVLTSFGDDFPDEARKLSTPEKLGILGELLGVWRLGEEEETARDWPKGRRWELLERLGKGVFVTNSAEDWRENVWNKLPTIVGRK